MIGAGAAKTGWFLIRLGIEDEDEDEDEETGEELRVAKTEGPNVGLRRED